MHIEAKPLRHWIDHFYGYGSWDASYWFINYEDGGGDLPEEVAEKLNFFFSTHASSTDATLCNIRDLYRHNTFRYEGAQANQFSNLYEYRFGQHARINSVWKNLSAFVHGYRNEPLPDVLEYQKHKFASPSEHGEALVKLYPLPSPNNHAWYYSWLELPQFDFLKTRKLYQEHLYPVRMQSILQQINNCKPKVVLMYGMTDINTIKQSIQGYFPETDFKLFKAIKLKIPQHHRADLDGTTLLLTTQIPTLRHNRIETGFDWFEFGRMVKG